MPSGSFSDLSCGDFHCLALKTDGSITAWGDQTYGETNVPVPNTGFVAVAAGGFHSLGLKADGSILAWGRNDFGQSSTPLPNGNFVKVAGGGFHSLGLKSDGSILAWGRNASGECNIPPPNSNFIAIAAGEYYSLGVKADGSIVAWGRNNEGQCNVPAPNSGFVAVAAGYEHSVGLKTDGTMVAWGRNDLHQLDLPINRGFTFVSGCGNYTLAIRSGGQLVGVPASTTPVPPARAFPNPTHASTSISFNTRTRGPAEIQILDVSGRAVRTAPLISYDAGEHVWRWDGRDVSGVLVHPGIYFFTVRSEQSVSSGKVTILR